MENEISGVLLIDKPEGFTSHDIVARARRALRTRSIGHFGTLDPFATGVLPLSAGKATRFAQFYLKSRKSYEGVIRVGFATDTYDVTGTRQAGPPAEPPAEAEVERALRNFTGRIEQTPPPFSAKRIGGVRAYKLARQRIEVVLQPVAVEIYAFELLRYDPAGEAHISVECGGGAYVRSLAHDLGQRLGCPAHLAALRRTAVAEFGQNRAVTLARLEELAAAGQSASVLIPVESLLPECPELVVRGREESSIRHGHSFELAPALRPERGLRGPAAAAPLLKIMDSNHRLIAVARHVSASVYHPDLVMA